MQLRLYDIVPTLQPYVKLICSMESSGRNEGLNPFRVLPDTCVELFINFIDPEPTLISVKASATTSCSFIVSRMNSFMDVKPPRTTGCLSVCFHPASARHFFPLPMSEISNQVVDLKDVWSRLATELEERIAAAVTNERRVAILQQYLARQLERSFRADNAIEYCLWQMNLVKGQLAVGSLSEKTGISNRQLARRFHEQVGLSPKEFARVTKFIGSLGLLKKYPAFSLTSIAYESGYYDQAHFIHDCKEFSGYAPAALLASGNSLY